MKSIIMRMSKGEVYKGALRFKVADLNEMAKALNNLVMGIQNYQEFANNIGNGNLDVAFTPLSKQDILGNSLIAMRNSLKENIHKQKIQVLELQRLNKELDSFTYHASHDLRAPLTTILGLVNLGLKDSDDPTSHSYFNMIGNRVDHMDKLLKDLISISYNNKAESSYEEFDFNSEVKNLLNSLNSGHRVEFDIQLNVQQELSFMGDPVRIRTILSNLISNSFKYYNPNVSQPFVEIIIRVDFIKASILVRDNGIGIEDAHQEKIFNMFFRGTTRSTGTGLGLFIVKSMVDRLNGNLEIESVKNEGTSFYVTIPNQLVTYKATDRASQTELAAKFAQLGSRNGSIL
jgi:signal transduction histidine kinase